MSTGDLPPDTPFSNERLYALVRSYRLPPGRGYPEDRWQAVGQPVTQWEINRVASTCGVLITSPAYANEYAPGATKNQEFAGQLYGLTVATIGLLRKLPPEPAK
jgi:hypothetical protein